LEQDEEEEKEKGGGETIRCCEHKKTDTLPEIVPDFFRLLLLLRASPDVTRGSWPMMEMDRYSVMVARGEGCRAGGRRPGQPTIRNFIRSHPSNFELTTIHGGGASNRIKSNQIIAPEGLLLLHPPTGRGKWERRHRSVKF
jgi:hypothetical protein